MTAAARVGALLVALVVTAVLGACGDDGGTAPDAQPAEEAATFVSGDFGSVPVHPLADEAGARTEKDDVIAQSYEVRNTSRDELFEWYAGNLDGWEVEEPPEALGEAEHAAWRARWTRDDRRLIVTVSSSPTLDGQSGDDDPVLQLSLSLEPRDRPGTA